MNPIRIQIKALAVLLFLCFAPALAFADEAAPTAQRPLRVACVGDSITYGFGLDNRKTSSYPARLQALLGEGWEVGNFGRNGATVLKKGHVPYTKQKQYKAALAFLPDVVVINLGTNDSRPMNWDPHQDQYVADYLALIQSFQTLETKPTVWVCTTPPVIDAKSGGRKGFNNETVIDGVLPKIREVAKHAGVGLIDLHAALEGQPDLFPDGVHPNVDGAAVIAKTVVTSLTGEVDTPATEASMPDPQADPGILNAPEKATSPIEKRPNFIIIFTDDQGYNDLSCFGGEHVSTPRIDQMADEGARLTSFYVAAAICTPSRAALMTGSYPKRVGMDTGVNLAGDEQGLNPDEITIAEVLKEAGYKTGMFGKWHLGDQPEFLPTRQGFDEFFGLPYSHDIHPFHLNNKKYNFPPLPLLEGETVVESEPDADYLTRRFTERAVAFIEKNKDEPFFMYVPHPIPHRPLHMSPPFMEDIDPVIKNKLSKEGDRIDYLTRDKLYRQAVAEIDWSVGQILDALKAQRIDENTFVIFSSDNGPRLGSARPLKGGKGSTYEGGMRMPTVVRWPGKIPAGRDNAELMTAMDLLPTFAGLAGGDVPEDRVLDGKDVWPVLTGKEKSPHEAFFYYSKSRPAAVRSGAWKLHMKGGKPSALFNLDDDIGEKKNVLKGNMQVAKKLQAYITAIEADLAKNSRPAGVADNPRPLTIDKAKGSTDEPNRPSNVWKGKGES